MIEIDDKAIQQYVYFPQNSNVEADSYSLVLHSELTQLDIEFTGLTDESKSKNYFKFLIDASQVDDGEYNYSIKANGDIVATGLIKIGEITDDIPETHEYDSSIEEDEVIQYYPTGNYKYRFQSNKIVEIASNGIYNVKPDSGYTALLNVEVHADIIPNKQIKDIEIVENSTVKVTADEGYAALSEVNVTVDVPVDDYYQSGYTSGYTDGFNTGYTSGCTDGYQEGYGDGVAEQKSKLVSTAITTNGTYEREDGYNSITVNVPSGSTINNQRKFVRLYDNGSSEITYDAGYTGLEKVNVEVEVPVMDYWNSGYTEGLNYGRTIGYASGYTSGKTDGVAEQKAKLVATAITSNGTYQKEDGYSSITVNVPSGSTINNQTKSITATTNGSSAITYDAGYTGLERVNVNVNVPTQYYWNMGFASGYTIGTADGVDEQKAKLVATAITSNGVYSKEDGYNSITVNVPQTGYTQQDLDNAYASGMTAQKAKLVVTGVTSNGIFSREDGFREIVVNVSGEAKNYNLTVSIISDVLSGLTNNAQVTVTYLAVSDTKTYEGNNLDFSILPGVDYTVSFGEVSGYTRPASISGTTTWNGSGLASGFYQTSSGTPYESQYLTLEILSGGTLGKPNNYTIDYSVNNGAWTNMTTSVTLLTGDTVRLRGTRPGDNIFEGNNNFTGSIVFNAYGNILSILYGDDFVNHTVIPDDFKARHFYELFKRLSVVSAENLILPQNTTNNCYDSMFSGCTSLISAPTIPASAVSIEACYYMFRGCTNLVNIPSILPATVLSNQCYQGMFEGCSSITTAPILPATALTVGCYTAIFNKCSSLTSAPVLPATTLTDSCYRQMFSECTSLTTAPELPATTLVDSCYGMMFYGCSNLSYIKCLATTNIDTNNSTTFFAAVVASDGTFVKASGAAWPSGNNGIPNNWTVQEV